MNPSMFSPGERPPRKWENVDTRNGVTSSGHVVASESLHRNCRDGCHGNHRTSLPGSFHDVLPNMHEIHNEAALYGADRVQRAPVHLTYNYNGQQSEHFCDHDHRQGMSNERFYQGITGSATTISNHTGHQHNVCDRGCCGSVPLHREKNGSANCSVDKTRPTSRSSLFVDSLEYHRNAAAVGSMSHCPSTPREVERMSSSLRTRSMANPGFPMQTKGANNQVMLYGWFLMNPHRERNSKDPPAGLSVAIGGYRCPNMEETDFYATATVVERLERWKLRTSDGLEVGLMGMINIEKSVANGFSPSLVQCFMIGFPSAWVYMLLNLQKCVPKGSSPSMHSLSARPTNSAGPSGVIRNNIKDCSGPPITLAPEANVVQSVLQSSLFTAGSDVETRMADLRRYSTAATTPPHDGVSSDCNSIPQSHLGHEQVDPPNEGDHTRRQTDFMSQKVAPTPDEPSSCRSPSKAGVLERDPCESPETSSQTQIPPKFKGCPSDKVDEREVSPGSSSIAKENMADEIHVEIRNGGAGTCDNEKDAIELASVAPEDVPCTPQTQTRKRLRSDTNTADADASPVKPVVVPKSSRQHVETSRLSNETPERVVNTPITLPVAGPVSTVYSRDRRKRLRGESHSLVDDIPQVEPCTVSAANPVGTVKPRNGRKRPRNEPHSPVADIPEVGPNIVSGADPVGTVKARDKRKKPRSESQSPVAETPEVKQIKVSDADPVGMVTPRDRRKLRSNAPVADIPVVEPIAVSVADPVGKAKTRDRRKRPRSESRSPVPDNPSVEPVTGPACDFRSSDCHVGASPNVTEEKAEAELREELQEDDIVIKREDLDVEVNQACKGKNVVKGRVRKKRFKISRNYYQRGKKKSSSKTAQAHEKVPPRSDKPTRTLKIPIEESKVETDESQVVQEMTEPSMEKASRSTMSTKRETHKFSSSLDVPESSAEEDHVKRSGRIKTSIVPPPLPPPRVADKSKVTEAFGLKRSQYGRVLVPPLATWRSQSIKYDTDGSIIAISDGFEGSEEENCTGYYNFKPPEDKDARTMQRRLCKAADKGSRKR